MKRIINTAPAVLVITQKTPFTVSLTTKVVGTGTLTQSQDLTQNLWSPDRTVSALIIEPVFSATDTDNGSPASVTPDIKWYVNKIQAWNSTTQEGQVVSRTTSDDYYLQTGAGSALTGRLVVRKNVDYRTPVTIICQATYTDNVASGEYTEESRVLLTSDSNPDAFYQVSVQAPAVVKFFPLTDSTSQKSIQAFTQHGNAPIRWEDTVGETIGAVDLGTLTWTYSSSVFSATLSPAQKTSGNAALAGYTLDQSLSSNLTISTSTATKIRIKNSSYSSASAFKAAMEGKVLFYELATKSENVDFDVAMTNMVGYFWYADDVLVDSTMLGYVSGQGTETIVLDADYIDLATISVKIAIPQFDGSTVTMPTSPNASTTAQCGLAWDVPHVEVLPIARGGSDVRGTSGSKVFDSVVRMNGKDVDSEKVDKYLLIKWFTHSTDASASVRTEVGSGQSIALTGSQMRTTGKVNLEVEAEAYLLDVYKQLTTTISSTTYDVVDGSGNLVVGKS